MKEKYHFENIGSVFQFGRYRYLPLCFVIKDDPSYFYWCINNVSDFSISRETLRQIRELFPMFIIPEKVAYHIKEMPDDEMDERESEFYDNTCSNPFRERPTYDRYNGSYAQDEMGYSDDEIDTIFDGDPLAYWNID